VCVHSELAQSAGQFARAVATLGTAEEHTSLARTLSQLSEVEEKVESVHQAQSDADFYVLAELIRDYIGMVHAVKVLCVISIALMLYVLINCTSSKLVRLLDNLTCYFWCLV